MTITLEPLDHTNWYKVYDLSVSEEQKVVFPIPNVQWIGISRYEEGGTKLFAIKCGGAYAGLIGGGMDEDGINGYINPLMVDEKFQHKGIAREALRLIIEHLRRKYQVPCIHINHRKENHTAAKLYESLGFFVYAESEKNYHRRYTVDYGVQILSLREHPAYAEECQTLLFEHFNESASKNPAEILAGKEPLPQGYFILKNDRVIGWAGLYKKDCVAGKIYGWEGSIKQDEIVCEDLSPWITPLLIHPDERGNRYGNLLLQHARKQAGLRGYQYVYLTTGEIGFYEKFGFREVGLANFTWGRPTKIYEAEVILSKL